MYNITQAESIGVDIIAVPNDIIYKYEKKGVDPLELSLIKQLLNIC